MPVCLHTSRDHAESFLFSVEWGDPIEADVKCICWLPFLVGCDCFDTTLVEAIEQGVNGDLQSRSCTQVVRVRLECSLDGCREQCQCLGDRVLLQGRWHRLPARDPIFDLLAQPGRARSSINRGCTLLDKICRGIHRPREPK